MYLVVYTFDWHSPVCVMWVLASSHVQLKRVFPLGQRPMLSRIVIRGFGSRRRLWFEAKFIIFSKTWVLRTMLSRVSGKGWLSMKMVGTMEMFILVSESSCSTSMASKAQLFV